MSKIEKLDVNVAARLASSFQLTGVQFALIEARMVEAADLADAGAVLSWTFQHVNVGWLNERGVLKVITPFHFEFRLVRGKVKGPIFARVVLMLRIDYAGKSKLSDAEIQHFAGIMGFMHAWPYVRAQVQTLTAQLGLPALTLPVMLANAVPAKATAKKLERPKDNPAPKVRKPAQKKSVSKASSK